METRCPFRSALEGREERKGEKGGGGGSKGGGKGEKGGEGVEDRREVFGMREVRCQFVFCLLLVCFSVAAYCCWWFVLCLLRRWLLFAGEQILKRGGRLGAKCVGGFLVFIIKMAR